MLPARSSRDSPGILTPDCQDKSPSVQAIDFLPFPPGSRWQGTRASALPRSYPTHWVTVRHSGNNARTTLEPCVQVNNAKETHIRVAQVDRSNYTTQECLKNMFSQNMIERPAPCGTSWSLTHRSCQRETCSANLFISSSHPRANNWHSQWPKSFWRTQTWKRNNQKQILFVALTWRTRSRILAQVGVEVWKSRLSASAAHNFVPLNRRVWTQATGMS